MRRILAAMSAPFACVILFTTNASAQGTLKATASIISCIDSGVVPRAVELG